MPCVAAVRGGRSAQCSRESCHCESFSHDLASFTSLATRHPADLEYCIDQLRLSGHVLKNIGRVKSHSYCCGSNISRYEGIPDHKSHTCPFQGALRMGSLMTSRSGYVLVVGFLTRLQALLPNSESALDTFTHTHHHGSQNRKAIHCPLGRCLIMTATRGTATWPFVASTAFTDRPECFSDPHLDFSKD